MSGHCLYFLLIEFIDDSSRKNDPSVLGVSPSGEGIETVIIENSDFGSCQASRDAEIFYDIIDLRIFLSRDGSCSSKFEDNLSVKEKRNNPSNQNYGTEEEKNFS
jgi:hypothetical protein